MASSRCSRERMVKKVRLCCICEEIASPSYHDSIVRPVTATRDIPLRLSIKVLPVESSRRVSAITISLPIGTVSRERWRSSSVTVAAQKEHLTIRSRSWQQLREQQSRVSIPRILIDKGVTEAALICEAIAESCSIARTAIPLIQNSASFQPLTKLSTGSRSAEKNWPNSAYTALTSSKRIS